MNRLIKTIIDVILLIMFGSGLYILFFKLRKKR